MTESNKALPDETPLEHKELDLDGWWKKRCENVLEATKVLPNEIIHRFYILFHEVSFTEFQKEFLVQKEAEFMDALVALDNDKASIFRKFIVFQQVVRNLKQIESEMRQEKDNPTPMPTMPNPNDYPVEPQPDLAVVDPVVEQMEQTEPM